VRRNEIRETLDDCLRSALTCGLMAVLVLPFDRMQAQRDPGPPPRRALAIVYMTPPVISKQDIAAVVDSNANVREQSSSAIEWPVRLKPEQTCQTNVARKPGEKQLSGAMRILSQHPLHVSVDTNASGASEVGTLVTIRSDTAVIAAHYLRVWRKENENWRVVFVCTSPIRP